MCSTLQQLLAGLFTDEGRPILQVKGYQILRCCSVLRPWPALLPQTRYPAVMTLTNHVLPASRLINTEFALNFLLLDISQHLLAAAGTQWEFCMEAKADIFSWKNLLLITFVVTSPSSQRDSDKMDVVFIFCWLESVFL